MGSKEQPMNGHLNGRFNLDTHCSHCKLAVTPEGHDGCIGTLPYPVRNACCGHGGSKSAYVQLDHDNYKEDPNGNYLSDEEAIEYIKNNSPIYKTVFPDKNLK